MTQGVDVPPIVDIDPILGHINRSTQIPEVITLPVSFVPLKIENAELTPSTSHWAATFTRKGANESNLF
jgi:hypothetical protein